MVASRPAVDPVIQVCECARHPFANMAKPHDSHWPFATPDRPVDFPLALPLLFAVGLHATAGLHQLVQHVFRHLHRHASIFQAHHGKLGGQIRHRQQTVNAGTKIEDGFEPGLPLEQFRRWLPDNGVIRVHRGTPGVPYVNFRFRKQFPDGYSPAFWLGVSGYKQNFHVLSRDRQMNRISL